MWEWATKACEFGTRINEEGKQDIYLTGWTWHNRNRYSSEKIDGFQEFAYGGGLGKSLETENGNEHSVYGLAFADSHEKPQLMIGYAYQAYWNIVGNLKFGAGYTFGLTSRRDIFYGIPFPHVLPLISLKYRAVTIMATYVPNLNGGQNGDIAFVLGKFTFN